MSPIKKEPLLTHDRNLLIGKIFAAGAIVSLILEFVIFFFLTQSNAAVQLLSWVINFISAILFIFVLFILRYYLLNFKMHRTRIALMTLIILSIIEFFYGKLSTVLMIFIGHFVHDYTYWFEVSGAIQSILTMASHTALLITGIMLIAGRGDFVGGLRALGVSFVLKAMAFVASIFVRNYMVDEYIANQESKEGLLGLMDMMSTHNGIEYIFSLIYSFGNIFTIIILFIFIWIMARAKKHTLYWQDPL